MKRYKWIALLVGILVLIMASGFTAANDVSASEMGGGGPCHGPNCPPPPPPPPPQGEFSITVECADGTVKLRSTGDYYFIDVLVIFAEGDPFYKAFNEPRHNFTKTFDKCILKNDAIVLVRLVRRHGEKWIDLGIIDATPFDCNCDPTGVSCPVCGDPRAESIYIKNAEGEVTGTRPVWVQSRSQLCMVCVEKDPDHFYQNEYFNDWQALKYVTWEFYVHGDEMPEGADGVRAVYLEGGWEDTGWYEDIESVDLVAITQGDEVVYRYNTSVDGSDMDGWLAHPEWVRWEYNDNEKLGEGTPVSGGMELAKEWPCSDTPDWYKLLNSEGKVTIVNDFWPVVELAPELVELGLFETVEAATAKINEFDLGAIYTLE